jgi:hypothetical protein
MATLTKFLKYVLIGAIIGPFAAIIFTVILLGTIGAFQDGIDGLVQGISGALYYGISIALFWGLVPGVIVGVFIGSYKVLRNSNEQQAKSSKVIVIFLALAIISFVVVPLKFVGQTKEVTYEADWFYRDDKNVNCEPEIVIEYKQLPLHKRHAESICSQTLADYLDSTQEESTHVKLSYTYDFGELRGYNVEQIGEYKLQPFDEWR